MRLCVSTPDGPGRALRGAAEMAKPAKRNGRARHEVLGPSYGRTGGGGPLTHCPYGPAAAGSAQDKRRSAIGTIDTRQPKAVS